MKPSVFCGPAMKLGPSRLYWHQVIGELEAGGIQPGPENFQWWNDGDAGLVRAI
jgi:hypothetical protein